MGWRAATDTGRVVLSTGRQALTLLTAAAVLCSSAGPAVAAKRRPAPAPTTTTTTRPFASSSFWNAPLTANAPIDPQSATYVAELQRQLTTVLPWINTTEYSSPVYTVPASQPTVPVILDKATTDSQTVALRDAFAAGVPIPAGAQPAAGTDATMIVYQPATDTMWELWLARRDTDGWHAAWGGKMQGVSTNPGHYTLPNERWGATASSLPMLGGLMRISELQAGRIDHALALAIPETRAHVYSWPAQRTDGNVDSESAIPEGTRFRIDPTVDLSTIPMAPIVREMALAVQRYGMVVRDRGGAVAFYGEDPTPTGTNPYLGSTGFFGGQYPSTLLAAFPWSLLRALQTQLAYDPL